MGVFAFCMFFFIFTVNWFTNHQRLASATIVDDLLMCRASTYIQIFKYHSDATTNCFLCKSHCMSARNSCTVCITSIIYETRGQRPHNSCIILNLNVTVTSRSKSLMNNRSYGTQIASDFCDPTSLLRQ